MDEVGVMLPRTRLLCAVLRQARSRAQAAGDAVSREQAAAVQQSAAEVRVGQAWLDDLLQAQAAEKARGGGADGGGAKAPCPHGAHLWCVGLHTVRQPPLCCDCLASTLLPTPGIDLSCSSI